ncbi:LTA synthase family protein [Methyloversatilis sp.]|uniref:LTA synthase family protein n=1 Tax=Methyloversatilis sp. TaxID=2569862 RepID=UPI00273777D4|nr:LTA synthase family protein [Methyloversatilis sp.]MDP2870167.1 LTA synthase family protein [Methyloversatilis sp.]MDP3289783.1 LTA synthase family protein [Methyloversatilis sp.]MDP3456054.1 LTA synthase family protein [Methyloversatilis sp.]MDP3580235.1 LTA synthase family protein [Methyloversatilis sp.]
MTSIRSVPRRRALPFLLVASLLTLAIWTLLRLLLWGFAGPADIGTAALHVFARGLWFDLAVLAWLVAPLLVLSALLPARARASRFMARLRWGALWLMAALLLFGAVSEVVFWEEFSTRFNFIAVDYLIYTQEVIGNIMQSYPVGLIVGGIALVAALIVFGLSRLVGFVSAPRRPAVRLVMLAGALVLPAASWQFAALEQMEGSGNAYADELAGNGLYAFAAAMRRNELDYERWYATLPQEEADEVLLDLHVERLPLSSPDSPSAMDDPPHDKVPFSRRPRNVVLVTIESLSAEYVGAYGSTEGLTPELDRLAAEGLRFAEVYATGTRTVRGLEALSLGTPPVPGQAIVRRAHNNNLSTVGELLAPQGVVPMFIYGGYGYFDNMNSYFRGNDYLIVDRTDFPKDSVVFENVWGVADEVLYANALKALNDKAAAGKPFFAQIMTTSNHRPYTYPDGRIDIASPGGRRGGVKYTDWAIGEFIREAKKQPWFADTLFVFVADHCASVAGRTRLPVAKYRIPLIFYAPDILQPGEYPQRVSQIDLAPTLIEVMGKNGDDHFFGRSFFEADAPLDRAFISNYQDLGYLRGNLLTVLSPRRVVRAFTVDPVTLESTPAEVDPQRAREAIAYYQTAASAFKQGRLHSSEAR